VTQHASLTLERWSAFSRDQQILMIASEMNRAGKLFGPQDRARLRNAYERVLRLADLTTEAQPSRSLRRELFRALLLLTPASAKQLPFLMKEEWPR
jgi:hypothetical protein